MMAFKVSAALLLLGLAGVLAQNCRNPNNEIGVCINLKQCPELLSILTSQPRTPASLDFLRRSQCGFDNRDPLVCCPQRNTGNNNQGGLNGQNQGGFNGQNPGNNQGGFNGQNPGNNQGGFNGQNPGNNQGGFNGQNPGNNQGGFNGQNPGNNQGGFNGQNPGNNQGGFNGQNPGNNQGGFNGQNQGNNQGGFNGQNQGGSNGQNQGNNQGGFNGQNPGGIDGQNQGGFNERLKSDLLPEDCGRDLSNRIVGGNITDIDEFPWMALLEYRKPNGRTTACGGVLISKRYVITAAHCIKGSAVPKSWSLESVRLGEYNTATERDCVPDGDDGEVCADDPVSVAVEQQIVHEDYNPGGPNGERYDIALLRLARDVSFTPFIKPICLPSTSDLNNRLVTAGWGKTETKSESDVKLKVNLPLVDREQCYYKYKNAMVTLGEGQICAGGQQGIDSCRGDSGGPLMQQERKPDGTQRWVSVGVVSFGPTPCGMPGWPGVYTKVFDFMPWIIGKLRP